MGNGLLAPSKHESSYVGQGIHQLSHKFASNGASDEFVVVAKA
jgi:hypothetical protein